MDEKIFARGKLFELVHQKQPDGRVFEIARRAPGVRVIVADLPHKKLLLTKEYRRELQAWDYRLPGGKVFDSLTEFANFRDSGRDMLTVAKQKAKAEVAEEAGLQVGKLRLVNKSVLGATIEWDLYIFEGTSWRPAPNGQTLEKGEQIEAVDWYSFAKAERMILAGALHEERVALVLLQWLQKADG